MEIGELRFFPTVADLRAWFEEHHATDDEAWIAFYKKDSGKPSITYPEAVDEALCFGWIDGVRKSVGTDAYTLRFTPRRRRSIWSQVNIRRMHELIAAGRVTEAGRKAFEARDEERTKLYSFERESVALEPEHEAALRANSEAWAYWEKQPPGYRKTATWWVISARQDETRKRRLATLIEDCAAGRPIKGLVRPGKK